MLTTNSEKLITRINQNVFYNEFTFDKTDFITKDNKRVELADNILWLDSLLIIIQIKERNTDKIDSLESLNKWFDNKVLNKAKEQIKNTNEWMKESDGIDIRNGHNHVSTLHYSNLKQIHNVIIYHINEAIPEGFDPEVKYRTQDGLFIHILSSEDYYLICRYLMTPTELHDFLNFREALLSYYPKLHLTERYILAHYFHNSKDLEINTSYIDDLEIICTAIEQNDNKINLFPFLDKFRDSVVRTKDDNAYIEVVKELAKLNRQEIFWFKQRLLDVIKCDTPDPCDIKATYISRTGCAIIIMKPKAEHYKYCENILRNNTEDYKYARRAAKGLGVIVKHDCGDVVLNWCLDSSPWKYNPELEISSNDLLSLFKTNIVEEKNIYEILK